MREIKFKVYVDSVIPEETGVYEPEFISGFSPTLGIDKVYTKHYKFKSDTCEFALLQYTGLKDKNDVEIYEGDIVEYKTENTEGSPKKPKTVKWVARKYYAGWNIGRSHLGYEVIGNIYEAPDLLKSDQPTSEHNTKTKASHD